MELPGPLSFGIGGLAGLADSYARMLIALLPPGRLWRLTVGDLATIRPILEASADELERLHGRAEDLFREADPFLAVELLPEHEAELGLEAVGSLEERQARALAQELAQPSFRPEDVRAVMAPLLGQLAADVVLIERTPADAAAMGDVREVFRFFVYRNPSLPGAYYLASAQAQLDAIKYSTTIGHAIESVAMICDDPHSIVDRDIVGA